MTPELNVLLARQDDLRRAITAHQDLLDRISSVQQARAAGQTRMELPVELGPGFSAEGVVEDTSRIICSAGLDDLWLDLPLDKATVFVKKRAALLEKRVQTLEEPIARMKEEYALVAKTLHSALELPDVSS
ncbi:hypothetical protein JCM21900_006343 [Sporobolomyces salmonicolor]